MCNCEYPEFYKEVQRVSVITHKCSECHKVIPVKTRYTVITGKWDGGIRRFKQCLNCKEIITRYQDKTDCCVPLGGLFEDLHDSDILWWDDEADIPTYVTSVDWLSVKDSTCYPPVLRVI